MLKIEDGILIYQLSRIENIGALSTSPKASVLNLKSVGYHENPWTSEVLRGIRAPGTGFPYLIMLGTMRHRQGQDFCVIYRRKPVLVLEFAGESFNRWVIPASKANFHALKALGVPNLDLPVSAP